MLDEIKIQSEKPDENSSNGITASSFTYHGHNYTKKETLVLKKTGETKSYYR